MAEAIASVAAAAANVLRVLFLRVEDVRSEKAPKYRALVARPAPMGGVSDNWPIFQDGKTGKYSVAVPSVYGTKSFVPSVEIRSDGFQRVSPEGKALLENLPNKILTAFGQHLRDGKAEQIITL
jgi:hypothetical protein